MKARNTFVLLIAAIFLALVVIGIAVTFAGGYEVEYRLNDRGIGGRPYGRTSKKNAIVNFLLMISGRATATLRKPPSWLTTPYDPSPG